MSIMPLGGSRHRGHSRLKDSKHDGDHRGRSRKHYPLSTMPHSHRGKRKTLHLDLECDLERNDSILPCTDIVSEDCSSLESNLSVLSNVSSINYTLPERNPPLLPNLRQLCEDFSFSLDSLNDNLNNQSSGPSPPIETTLHCPFAALTQTSVLPTVNIHERILGEVRDPVSGVTVTLSDYGSEADDEREDTENCEEEIPLIVDSDCSEDDSLQEFFSFPRDCDRSSSCSDIPFQQVSSSVSTSTVSASNSLDSLPTTSSNESLSTVSTTSTTSELSSKLYECPENYEMLYRNFEIAARMEENQSDLRNGGRDIDSSSSSNYSSNTSADSSRTFTFDREGNPGGNFGSRSRQNRMFPPKDTVTTFAKLADSKRRSPVVETEVRADSPQGKSVTHWTEVLSKQSHSSKDSPESGINSPVDPSPESPKVKRPYFLPLPLRHIQRPAAKPIAISAEDPPRGEFGVPRLPRTLSAPTGGLEYPYGDQAGGSALRPSVLVGLDRLSINIAEEEKQPAQETGDLISWTQSVKQLPCRSLSAEGDHTSSPDTLLDWGDIRQSPRGSVSSNDSHSLGRSLQRPDRFMGAENHFQDALLGWRDIGEASRVSLHSHDSHSLERSVPFPNGLLSVGDHSSQACRNSLSSHDSHSSDRSAGLPNQLLSVEDDRSSKSSGMLLDSADGRSLSSEPQKDNHRLKQAPLIDWEDIFTSRQSFCELDSPEKKQNNYHSLTSNDCVDINANFSVATVVGDGPHSPLTMRPKLLEDKAINTSPFKFRNCNCGMATVDRGSVSVPATGAVEGVSNQQKTESPPILPTPPKPKPTLLPLPLQSVDYFSDSDDSLSSLESLEMDDCVFRESLYSLTSEHLYQSQTFGQVAETDIQEDSLCEATPPPQRSARIDPETRSKQGSQLDLDSLCEATPPPRRSSRINPEICYSKQGSQLDLDSLCEATPPLRRSNRINPGANSNEKRGQVEGFQELYNPRSVLTSTCLLENKMHSRPREDNIPGALGSPLDARQESEPSPTDERMVSLENRRNEGVKRRLEDLYQLNFIPQDATPRRVIKHRPLKPIRQVDAEYRCRKALEQLTKPSHSLSAPSLLSNASPQTIFVATNSTTLGQRMVPPQGRRDDRAEGQEDILDASPPQEIPVSPKAARGPDEKSLDQKRGLVLAVKSAVQQVVQYFHRGTDTAEKVNPSSPPLKGDVQELVVGQLCPSIEALVRDGMKQFSNSWLVGRVKNTPWIVVQATTQLGPGTRGLNDLYNAISGSRLLSPASRRFNAFIMGLLNNGLMCDWMEHCRDHPNIMGKYYEPSAFLTLCNAEPYAALFHDLVTALGHLSELPFQLDCLHSAPSVEMLSEETSEGSSVGQVLPRGGPGDSPRRSSTRGERSGESWSSYVDSKKLTSSMWSLVGKVKKYTSIQGPVEKPSTAPPGVEESPVRSPQRGECDGGPAEEPEVIRGLEERIANDKSPERRWSSSWIQGFANAVPKSAEQSTVDESLLPAPKTWSEVFKAAKWQRFGSGWGQMMPKLKWKSDGPAGTPVPPLYERQVTGCGTPVSGLDEVMTELAQEKGNYSNVRTQVKTRCHYVSLNAGELSFMKGDVLTVRGQPSNEWLNCSLGSEAGLVHVDYIQELD